MIDKVRAMISTMKEMKSLFKHARSRGEDYTVEEPLDVNSVLSKIQDSDIDWESLKLLSKETLNQVINRTGACLYVRQSKDGEAEVIWELIPPGAYYWDDKTCSEYILNGVGLRGMISRRGNVLKKFTYESISIGYKDKKEDDEDIV